MEEYKAKAGEDIEMPDASGTKTAAVNGSQYTFGQQSASSISPQRQEMQHPGLPVPPAQPPKIYATSSTSTTTGTGLAAQTHMPSFSPVNNPAVTSSPALSAMSPAAGTTATKRKRGAETPQKSKATPATKRAPRLQYDPEQDDFIRFLRDDLCQTWDNTAKLYNQHWHEDGVNKREIPGLQSRYYRLLDESVRDRKKELVGRPELGILAKTNRRYWWMIGAYTDEERAEMEREKREMQESARQRDMETASRSTETSGSSVVSESPSPGPESESEATPAPEATPVQIEKAKSHTQSIFSSFGPGYDDEEEEDEDDDVDEDTLSILWQSNNPGSKPSQRLRGAVNAFRGVMKIPSGSGEGELRFDNIRRSRQEGGSRVARKIRARTRDTLPQQRRSEMDERGNPLRGGMGSDFSSNGNTPEAKAGNAGRRIPDANISDSNGSP